MTKQQKWNIKTAKQHYRIEQWGNGYFDINSKGNVIAKVSENEINIYALIKELRDKNIGLPVLVRFPQILQRSLSDLCNTFKQAISSHEYLGKYIPAYPIKVNQQATVIQHFQQQTQWPIAFEVGSKAELVACLGIIDKEQTIICNGYKDESYIRLALMGGLLGHEIIIVLESLAEFEYVIKQCSNLKVQANLGMRVRLSSIAKGNWQNTGGEHSKFGLTSNEVLCLVEKLEKHDALSWMKMLHFHMGSQIPHLQDIKSGLMEGMHYFSQLAPHGIKFEQLNVGGGLAVDYQGSHSNDYFSMGYSLKEYAETIISVVNSSCKKNSLNTPTIYSENGRAMTAYHAVLLTEVIDAEYEHQNLQDEYKAGPDTTCDYPKLNSLVKQIEKIKKCLKGEKNYKDIEKNYTELKSLIEGIEQSFSQGKLTLIEKAHAEKLINSLYQELLVIAHELNNKICLTLENKQVAKYFCNFSLFQSIPDVWGLQQIFPIMPLHRLQEFPRIKSRIYDLTCDSDGRIDKYVEADSIKPYLSLHEFHHAQAYILGIFLVGAYQEILGDMHNLFGDTNAVNIVMNADGSYQICDEEPGDTIAEILSYLHIDTDEMRKLWLEKLLHNNMSEQLVKLVLDEFDASLNANSYLS